MAILAKGIDPGKLRHDATVKAPGITVNDDGTWDNVPTGSDMVPIKFEWMSGEEFQDSNRQTRTANRRVIMRHYDGLTPGHQLIYDGRTFDILSVEDFEERRDWHILKVVEVV
jgi:SPP1 family predicted phage head-tail adaptor